MLAHQNVVSLKQAANMKIKAIIFSRYGTRNQRDCRVIHLRRIRTWQIEAFVVGATLSVVAIFSGHGASEWIGACAVLASFLHGQVTDRLAEQEASRPAPNVECYRHALRYFVAKELLWCVYFVVHRSWSALVGVGLFLAYPIWRKWWRKQHHYRLTLPAKTHNV